MGEKEEAPEEGGGRDIGAEGFRRRVYFNVVYSLASIFLESGLSV